MNKPELYAILARGEDSHHQFKRDFTNVDALASELIAFANSEGGRLLIGVTDDGKLSGLKSADVARLNQLLSNASSQEEMQRLFQQSGLVYADEMPAKPATIADLNQRELGEYFQRRYGKSVEATGLALPKLLQNLNLAHEGVPTLAGLLLFGNAPTTLKPAFIIKASTAQVYWKYQKRSSKSCWLMHWCIVITSSAR